MEIEAWELSAERLEGIFFFRLEGGRGGFWLLYLARPRLMGIRNKRNVSQGEGSPQQAP